MPGPALPCGLQGCGHLRDACPLMLCDLKVVRSRRSAVLSGNRRRSVRSPVALNNLFVSVAVRHDDESQVRHRDVQRDHRRLVSAMRSRRGSKGTSRFPVQLTLKPQTTKAVYECFQLRRRITKTRRSAKYDSIGLFHVGMRWGSVLGEHPFAALLPAGNFRHHIR